MVEGKTLRTVDGVTHYGAPKHNGQLLLSALYGREGDKNTYYAQFTIHHIKLPMEVVSVAVPSTELSLFIEQLTNIANASDNEKLAEADKLKLRAREIEREVLDKGRDSDCG
jgi:hypothetical protein